MKVGVLVSGSGSNLQALLDAGDRHAYDIACVVSSKRDAFALERAAKHGVPARFVDPRGLTREDHERAVTEVLDAHDVAFVALAGYMRILTPWFVDRWRDRLVNVHPALLPAFPGAHGARDALAHGARVTGCTFHLVDEHVDHGPIVHQVAVPVLADDDEARLQARIQVQEHAWYPRVLDWFARGLVHVHGRRVVLDKATADVTAALPGPAPDGEDAP